MPDRIARIRLEGDARGIRSTIKEVGQILEALKDKKLGIELDPAIKKILEGELTDSLKKLEDELGKVKAKLKETYDPKHLTFLVRQQEALTRAIRDSKQEVEQLNKSFAERAVTSTGKYLFSRMGRIINPATSALAAVGLSFGVGAGIQRARRRAEDLMPLAAYSGGQVGNIYDVGRSRMGFAAEERIKMGTEVSRAMGRQMSRQELFQRGGQVDRMETFRRAFNIGTEQQSQALGSFRRGGGGREADKVLAETIGAAVSGNLEGSALEEYLSSIAGYTEQMSKGMSVDTDSLNQLGSVLMGASPWFRQDPSRAMGVTGALGQAFSQGNPFQHVMGLRAMQSVAPGAGQAQMELRRQSLMMNLGNTKGDRGLMQRWGLDQKLWGAGSGANIANQMYKQTAGAYGGLPKDQRLFAMTKALGFSGDNTESGIRFVDAMDQAGGDFGKLTEDMRKTFEDRAMTAEEKSKKAMETWAGSMVSWGEKVETIMDKFATAIGNDAVALEKHTGILNKLSGLSASGAQTATDTGVGVGGALAVAGAAGAGALLPGAAKGIKRIVKATAKGGVKAGGKAAGRIASKVAGRAVGIVPFIGNLANAGFLAKDAYDMYQHYQETGRIENKDAAIALVDLIGIVPGIGNIAAGVAAGASVGGEFAPDMGGWQIGKPKNEIPTNFDDLVNQNSERGLSLPDSTMSTAPAKPVTAATTGTTGVAGESDKNIQLATNTVALKQLTLAIRNIRTGGGGRQIVGR